MYPCLGVDEILRLLAHELVASKAKATAVALACCYKRFEDSVLNTLWETQDRLFLVDSPLTEEARGVLYQLPKLTELWAVIQGVRTLSPVVLPNRTLIDVECDGRLD